MAIKDIASLVGIISSLVFAVRWLLGFYFGKAHELETMKAARRSEADAALSSNIADLRTAVTVFRQELNDMKLKMAEYNGQLREGTKMMEVMQKQWERTAERLEARYVALEGAEIVQIGKNTFMFKTRSSARG